MLSTVRNRGKAALRRFATSPQAETVVLRMRKAGGIEEIKATVGQSLLAAAHHNRVNIDGTCDGKLACSTCHVVIHDSGVFARSETKTALEADLLSSAFDVQQTSRLACQVTVTKEMEGMEVSYPGMVDTGLRQVDSGRKAVPQTRPAIKPKAFKNLTKSAIKRIFEKHVDAPVVREKLAQYQALAEVIPFRTNNYVVEELIDWSNLPDDPMFQLAFPQPGMLPEETLESIYKVKAAGGSAVEVRRAANAIRETLNPHPAKQKEMNVPNHLGVEGVEFERGMQHKYRETVLFFPSEAQYCHSYCTYCFRWAQFAGSSDLQFASNSAQELTNYLRQNPSVSDLLLTGGDPMVMNSAQLGKYLDAVASDPTLDHVQSIRIGSKSLAYWPYKYVTDDDADDMLRLLERVVQSGKHITLQAHFSHPAELRTPVVREAIRRLRMTGIQIRCQAPIMRHINDDSQVWAEMWREQVKLGMVPYYQFIARDTGPAEYFSVTLGRALDVYSGARQQLSGLAHTARGPSMSCTEGKVCVMGRETVAGEDVFLLKFLQSRNPAWQERVFFAKYDPDAVWIDELRPAFGEEAFFYEAEHAEMERAALVGSGSSGQIFQGPLLSAPGQADPIFSGGKARVLPLQGQKSPESLGVPTFLREESPPRKQYHANGNY